MVAEALDLVWIFGGAEAFGQIEKRFLFFLLRFDAFLDELDQNTVVAEATALGHAAHLFGDLRRKRDAAADLLRAGHGNGVRHYVHFGEY